MTKLTHEDVDNLIELSMIECSKDEKQSLLKDLSKILTHIDQLNELNTDQVQPCYHVLSMSMPIREDNHTTTMSRQEFLSNAPEQIGGLVRVPTIIHKS